MTIPKTNSSAMKARAARNMDRIREEFKTCEYPNSGAYADIPTKRGNLEERSGLGLYSDGKVELGYRSGSVTDEKGQWVPCEKHGKDQTIGEDCEYCEIERDYPTEQHHIACCYQVTGGLEPCDCPLSWTAEEQNND